MNEKDDKIPQKLLRRADEKDNSLNILNKNFFNQIKI